MNDECIYIYFCTHYFHVFGKTSFLFYDIMLMYCVISQWFDITGYDPELSVLAPKFPKIEIYSLINNFPHLIFCTHSSSTCSPITDSYITIYGLLIPHTTCFRTLKIHLEYLCTMLCLLILTHCVVDEPAQFHFPFSSITPVFVVIYFYLELTLA